MESLDILVLKDNRIDILGGFNSREFIYIVFCGVVWKRRVLLIA